MTRDYVKEPLTPEEDSALEGLYSSDMRWASEDASEVAGWLVDVFVRPADIPPELRGVAHILAKVISRMSAATPAPLGVVNRRTIVRDRTGRIAGINESPALFL